MDYKYSFEKLDVWHNARKFVTEIYKISSIFPSEEKFGPCSKLQRAAVLLYLILLKEFHDYLIR